MERSVYDQKTIAAHTAQKNGADGGKNRGAAQG
jgi:hypothetical protein